MTIDIPTTQQTSNSAKQIINWFQEFFKADQTFELNRFLQENITADFFKEIGVWSEEKYLRIKLFANEHCEVIMLCWAKDQIAPKHNHDKQDCYVHSIDGYFEEKRYDCDDCEQIISTHKLNPGDVTQMIDTDNYHSLENKTGKPAKSLHFYAKPINKCDVYCNDTNQFIERTLTYDCCISDFI
ncbi:MAG: cysteine dioxygenase [Parvicella sp.]|jgi:cysteine dioxygenase